MKLSVYVPEGGDLDDMIYGNSPDRPVSTR